MKFLKAPPGGGGGGRKGKEKGQSGEGYLRGGGRMGQS